MATTIAPALGNAPLYTSGGVGASPGYTAIDDRRQQSAALQAGVLGVTDFKVVQRGSGANMSIDVTMPVGGGAYVQGTGITGQGLYYVPVHASTINEAIAASNVSNPRIDSVYVHAYDNQHDSSSRNDARIEVVTGTVTAGATLDNRNGAPGGSGGPAVPGSSLLLADILVPAGSSTVVTANIRDRRSWARGACATLNWTSGTLYSSASTTMAELNSALSMRLELTGVPLLWIFRCQTFNTFGTANDAGPWIDGAAWAVANGGGKNLYGTAVASVTGTVMATHLLTGITAGSHLVSAGGNSGSGSGTANFLGDTTRPAQLTVRELVNQSANNS